jgi:signal transduction histidine kinase
MRALIFELRSGALDEGLVAALTEHASQLSARDGLIIEVRGPEGRLPLSAHAEAELFGVAREALANVIRHAGASKAWVRVEAGQGQILVRIRDDGRGFDPAADRPGHFGLESMRGRAAEIGGRLTIASRPGMGTAVLVEAPARPEEVTDGA